MQTITSAAGGGLMAAWLASGGTIEALDGAAAQAARSRRHAAAGDDGLAAGAYTIPYCATDDGLQAGRVTGSPPICVDDGLQA